MFYRPLCFSGVSERGAEPLVRPAAAGGGGGRRYWQIFPPRAVLDEYRLLQVMRVDHLGVADLLLNLATLAFRNQSGHGDLKNEDRRHITT